MARRRRSSIPKKEQSPEVSLSVTSAYVNRIITAIMAAGGAVLKEDYGFSEEQLGEWAQKTVRQAKGYLGLTKDEGRKTKDEGQKTNDEGRKTDGRGKSEAETN